MRKFFCLMLLLSTSVVSAGTLAVQFSDDDVKLSGSLFVPETAGPHPAIVLVHGSGPSDRSAYIPIAEFFAKSGFTALAYDKRGTGESSGSWIDSSIEDLANDVSAGMNFLKTRPEVNPDCIGLWGVSQAGWIVPLVNQKTPFAFLIMVTGGGASPLDTEMYGYKNEWKHAGLTDAEKTKAKDLLQRYFQYLRTGDRREELLQQLEISKNERWYSTTPLDRILPSEQTREKWAWVATYDPVPDIEKMRMPVLLLFGGKDMQTPTELAIRKWKEGLTKAGNERVTIRTFPEAAHAMSLGMHTAESRGKFVPGYFDAMQNWLNENAGCKVLQ